MSATHIGERIAIIGCSGAGKSHLSRELARRLALPIVHLDQLAWEPGWVEVPNDELARRQAIAFTPDGRWIADGNYGSTMPLRFAVADTIIWLDLPTHVCLRRILKRRVQYFGRTRPDMTPGCPERFLDGDFVEFLHFVATFRRNHRPRIVERLEAHAAGKRVIQLTTPRAVERFVAAL